ncbi:MAG: hypothetical protein ACLR6B_16585 [Blautia sp.]
METLLKRINVLTLENQRLHEKVEGMQAVPLLYKGEMAEFYEGEVRDVLLDQHFR